MVAKVISGKTIRGILKYNENKVQEGTAICLYAHNFPAEVDDLTFQVKLDTFFAYKNKNIKVETNAIHISLSFDRHDELQGNKMRDIAVAYLNKIGFGDQPYLVYQHRDAAHPHLHIATTNVTWDGKRIDLHNIGQTKSSSARREIEAQFNLVKADGRKLSTAYLKPIDLARAEYGKTETKRSISNIVRTVTRSYKFCSVAELNAVLRQFNVLADIGAEGSLLRSRNGLRYSIIDAKGKPIGIPIKASSIYGKPTIKVLEPQFEVNGILRRPHGERLKVLIHEGIKSSTSLQILTDGLLAKDVYSVIRQNEAGRIYGITFVDNETKCVFNGSDLGKAYSAAAIVNRLDDVARNTLADTPRIGATVKGSYVEPGWPSLSLTKDNDTSDLLSALMGPRMDKSGVDPNLRKRRKRRKRKSL